MMDDYLNSTENDDGYTYNINNPKNMSNDKSWINNEINYINNENEDDYEFDQTVN